MATAVEHRLGRDQIIWSFGPSLEPVLEVEPGETVVFETNDCFTGQIRSEDDLVTEIDLERINSATGPVAVRGAEPGDSVVAEILDVRPVEQGVATLIPGFGQLIEPTVRFKRTAHEPGKRLKVCIAHMQTIGASNFPQLLKGGFSRHAVLLLSVTTLFSDVGR